MAGIALNQPLSTALVPQSNLQGKSTPNPISRLSSDLIQMVLSFNDVKAASCCRKFKSAMDALIKREWGRFDLASYPNIYNVFLGRPPTSCSELGYIVDMMEGKCHIENLDPNSVATAVGIAKSSFSPIKFKPLEDVARQAENDRNLKLIWPRIARSLNIEMPLSSAEIKQWFAHNRRRLAQIEYLDLSDLNLTMIPEEFCSLALPNLITLNLSKNRLTTLPVNFGATWEQLQKLNLSENKLARLHANFGDTWRQLKLLYLANNQLTALPARFGANWNELLGLFLENNYLKVLAENFGANWNQLQELNLNNNQLAALSTYFGTNWNELTRLYLNSNELRSLPDNFVAGCRQLRILNLSHNLLAMLPVNFGAFCNRLEELNLSHNQLATLAANFGASWKLVDLDLSHNQLVTLPANFGAGWDGLAYFLLNSNPLASLPTNFGANWSELEFLGLDSNLLTELSINFGFKRVWRRDEDGVLFTEDYTLKPALVEQPILNPQPQKTLLNAANVYAFTIVALYAIGIYAAGVKTATTIATLYGGYKALERLSRANFSLKKYGSHLGQTLFGRCRLPAIRV